MRRDNCFDFIRLFAALVVVVAHAQTDLRAPVLWGVWQVFDGIAIFFILSGMLVYQSALSTHARTNSFRDFYVNRYLRIAPGIYAFAVIAPLSLVLVGAISVTALMSPQLILWLGSAFVLLPNYHPTMWAHVGYGVINGQLWTIPAEVSFYLVVPLLVLFARRFGNRPMILTLLAIGIVGPAIGYYTGPAVVNFFHHTFIASAAYFGCGVLWAINWRRVGPRPWLLVAAVVVYVALKLAALGNRLYTPVQPTLLAIPLSYAVVYFGYQGPRLLSRLTRLIGDLSFGTYVWHVLVINVLIWKGWTEQWWAVLAVIVITLVIAELSWRLVEKPALRLKRVSLRDDGLRPDDVSQTTSDRPVQ